MGFHRQGQTVVGAYISDKLKEYLDKLTAERGFTNRSDAIRTVIREHRFFSSKINRNQALTPEDVTVDDNIAEVKNE